MRASARDHFDASWDNSIDAVVKSVLARADAESIHTQAAAIELADQAAQKRHPIWGHRTAQIIGGLVRDGWANA